jgi:acid phosphatase family membrane protein YuiD
MLSALLHNVTVIAALAGYVTAQSIKLVTVMIRDRKFDVKFLGRLGGMPSSHATTAAACAMSVGLRAGFDSAVFAVAFGILALVMIDAQSVRRAAGAQARLLNRLTDDFYRTPGASGAKLTESLGHSRLEVLVGAMLGFLVAWLTHRVMPS